MKIKWVGRILVTALVVVNLVIVLIGYRWMEGFNDLQTDWHNYSENVEKKSALTRLLQKALGYGGMIHSLKNYILRNDKKHLLNVHMALYEIKLAIVAYSQLPLSRQEEESLQVMETLYNRYLNAAIEAELLHIKGIDVIEIDSRVKVNDVPAIAALSVLVSNIDTTRQAYIGAIANRVEFIDRRSMVSSALITILLFGLAAYFAWFFRRQLIAPINDLLQAFDSIDAGKNVAERLPVSAKGVSTEINELAMAGNRFLDVVEAQLQLQKSAERRATESEQRVSAILNSTAEGIITIDDKGLILSFNPKCEALFGYDSEQIIGCNVNKLMRAEEQQTHQEYIDNAKKMEKRIINTNRDLWGQHKSGYVFPMELTVSSADLNGQKCFVGVLHDISARKANEFKLLSAKREAEKANAAKSQFLSAMSHELRTPLNAILGFSQLMIYNRKDPLTSKQSVNTEQIMQAGQHLLVLINDILDLTKIESGSFEIDFDCVSLNEIIEECLEMIGQQAKKANITIVIDTSLDNDYQLHSSFTRLKQVMLNLLSNAIKYNRPDGKVTISVASNQAGMLQINVRDTGSGISKENYKGVFEPFVRFDKNATEIEGTGIGLSVCTSLVEAMKGKIGFTSEVDIGSTFYVYIPLFKADKKDWMETTQAVDENQLQNLGYADKTLLCIEDSNTNMILMKALVANISEMRFISASDAETGIVLTQTPKTRPDIIFMDINLPGMDGFEALSCLQSNEDTKKIPVIALSASATKDNIADGIKAGFLDYLTKPLRVEEVAQAIYKALS
jgi:PAS domain S-box-containing protein